MITAKEFADKKGITRARVRYVIARDNVPHERRKEGKGRPTIYFNESDYPEPKSWGGHKKKGTKHYNGMHNNKHLIY